MVFSDLVGRFGSVVLSRGCGLRTVGKYGVWTFLPFRSGSVILSIHCLDRVISISLWVFLLCSIFVVNSYRDGGR